LEKPVQRGVHVPGTAGRKIGCLKDGAAQIPIGKLPAVQDDFRVIAAYMGHKIPHEWCIRGLVEVGTGDESCAIVGEVNGERAYPPSLLDGDRPVRHRRYRRGVEPTGEQTAQRYVGNDLPLDSVFE
jgi:hypothetical protein